MRNIDRMIMQNERGSTQLDEEASGRQRFLRLQILFLPGLKLRPV